MAEIDAFVYTSPGGRTVNEDYCSFELGSGRSSFVVADGLGGHEKGEIASELAGRFMMERLMCMDQITVESLKEALRETNQCVLDGQNQYPGMRTTMAAVIEEKGQLWECHTGDSRIYLFKNRCLYFQSREPLGRTALCRDGRYFTGTDPVPSGQEQTLKSSWGLSGTEDCAVAGEFCFRTGRCFSSLYRWLLGICVGDRDGGRSGQIGNSRRVDCLYGEAGAAEGTLRP